jgi:hypothetical protein
MRCTIDLLVACEVDIMDEAKNMQHPDKRAQVQAVFKPIPDDEMMDSEQIEMSNPFCCCQIERSQCLQKPTPFKPQI